MDQAIRNKLRNVVTQCRKLLEEAVSHELQGRFGIYASGRKDEVHVDADDRMTHLAEEDRAYRRDILDHLRHIEALGSNPNVALAQLVREIAFTHLNRFCAYKMMEARGLIRESVSKGLKSQGFLFYLADHPDDEERHNRGERDLAYRHFLNWLGGTLSEEIGVLFSPTDPANRLYPPQRVLDSVLDLLNTGDIGADETELAAAWADIWSADETIGWVYQYFTPKELRDQARKESQAPRNSYELAFRNQFFTPRYVVEFLTDNTLGRIWYEMRKGDTRLRDQCRYMVRRPSEVFLTEGQSVPEDAAESRDDLSQEDLLRQPVHIPHRPKKDPRELKILDPACGSGHFLLYCFDLLQTIYEEAWGDPELGPAIQQDYPTLDALRRDVPRLILARNLHGIDIDLRATQIAALALWLRCQRAWQEMGVKKDRPRVTRSNIVCAEPMPGEQRMLKEFVSQVEPKLLGQLVEVVFDKMKLAGEAGSLLKIEEEIREAVAVAKRQWEAGPVAIQRTLFERSEPKPQQKRFNLSGITDEEFFDEAEAKVVDALRRYAGGAQNGQRLQRQLFTEDAVRGFAFVETCHLRFDVVLMNPPFGDASLEGTTQLNEQLAESGRDIGAAFVAAAHSRWTPDGVVGVVLSSTPLFKPTFEEWRRSNLLGGTASLRLAAHLGGDILDGATVSACALVTHHSVSADPVFFRLIRAADKHDGLASSIVSINRGTSSPFLHIPNLSGLVKLSGSPIAYWISRELQKRLAALPRFEGTGGTVKQGTASADEFRFARAWWEVAPTSNKWMPYTKTSEYSPFWDDPTWVLNFANDGEEMRSTGKAVIRAAHLYGKPGVTYPSKAVLGFNPRVHPAGGAFGHTGSVAFGESIDQGALLGLLASRPVEYALSLFLGSLQGEAGFHPLHYEVGVIARLPFPPLTDGDIALLSSAATAAVQNVRRLFCRDETSHDFISPLVDYGSTLDAASRASEIEESEVFANVSRLRCTMDDVAAKAYAFTAKDIEEMEQEFAERVPPATGRWRRYFGVDRGPFDVRGLVSGVLSFAVGATVGRWDVRIVESPRQLSELSNVFASIPISSPGMLQGSDGLPARAGELQPDYPLRVRWDGILVDDLEHQDDIVQRTRDALDVIWGVRSEPIEDEACEILGVTELRDYFRKPGKGGFWDDHVSRYSKSRRKAPIYWLLQSSKKNYALWLYYHRLDKDLLFKALHKYVEPKIQREQNRVAEMRARRTGEGGSGKGSKKLDKELEKQEDFLSELQDFEAKLRRAANLNLVPDLNDGVVLNIAPLHELVPWKEARNYWEELLEGKYEWSSIGKQLREKGLVSE